MPVRGSLRWRSRCGRPERSLRAAMLQVVTRAPHNGDWRAAMTPVVGTDTAQAVALTEQAYDKMVQRLHLG